MTGTRTPAVHLDGITKRFGDVLANDDVEFTLEQGSIHALIGENGAGKSTLMSVLYGLYEPNSGEIVIDGEAREFGSPRDAIDAASRSVGGDQATRRNVSGVSRFSVGMFRRSASSSTAGRAALSRRSASGFR